MKLFALALKVIAPIFVAVAALHLVLGLNADRKLGAVVSPETLAEATLNSQNRFFGVSFAFYGVALYLCATDIPRYEPIFRALLYVFFLAGLGRVVSWVTHGAPTVQVMGLLATELLLPPLLLIWYGRVKNAA